MRGSSFYAKYAVRMLILGQEITIFGTEGQEKAVLATLKAAICTKSAFFVSTRPNEVDRALYLLLKIY